MGKLILIPLLFSALSGQVEWDWTQDPPMAVFPGNLLKAHAAALMYVSTGGTVAITTGGTFEKLLGGAVDYTADHTEDFNETTNGRLTYIGTPTKEFFVIAFCSLESGETTQTVMIRIAEGGATFAGSEVVQDYSAVNSHSNTPTGWIVELATNEYVEIFVTSDQDGDDIIVHNAIMIVIEL